MLRQLLRAYLGKYRRALAAVFVLQLVQTTAALYLPSLNADIIDKGVATGDHAYIWRIGALMLVVRRGFKYRVLEGCSGASDRFEDFVGGLVPDERCGVVVPVFDPGVERVA